MNLALERGGLLRGREHAAEAGDADRPSASLVAITLILSAIGLPLEGVGLILAVDRVLDMCRTTVNVLGDTAATVVVARLEGEEILRG